MVFCRNTSLFTIISVCQSFPFTVLGLKSTYIKEKFKFTVVSKKVEFRVSLQEVRKLEGRLEQVSTLVAWVNQEESLFKFQLSSFPLLSELKVRLLPFYQV